MNKIALLYSSQTGSTEEVAKNIIKKLNGSAKLFNAFNASIDDFEDYTHIIIGSSTTGIGEMQPELEDLLIDLAPKLSGKTIAIFALGDAESHADTFAGSMKYVYDEIVDSGCTIVGGWPDEGYDHDNSPAVVDGKFVGLPIDEVNEPELTESRVDEWLKLIAFN